MTRRFIGEAIERPGALTREVGGPPGDDLPKVRRLAARRPCDRPCRQAQFFLNVLRAASRKRAAHG